jgi:hypothetical protein
MRVPGEVRKCVAFLMWRKDDKEGFAGTVFFVAVPLSSTPNTSIIYAVTAAHVIKKIEEFYETKIADGYVYFRLNTRDSTCMAKNKITDWHFHPNDLDIDIAVSLVPFVFKNMDLTGYRIDSFVTDDTLREHDIKIGEDVFISGLFSQHAGVNRNIPIVRMGNIAAMPEEPVNTSLGPMEAYLVETRSIGGLSGSPVFVHLGVTRKVNGKMMISASDEGVYLLLGLMHGHWDLAVPDIFPAAPRYEDLKVKVNSGIGIVVPAQKILEVLNQRALLEQRKEFHEAAKCRMETARVMDTVAKE